MILRNGLVMDETFTLRQCDLKIENGVIAQTIDPVMLNQYYNMPATYIDGECAYRKEE